MNAKTIISALILSVAAVGAAQAANSEPDNVPFQGVYGQSAANSLSRAQVVAELQQAHAAGLTGNSESNDAPFTAQADTGVTRAQVVAGIDRGNTATSIAFGDPDNQPFQGA